MDKFIEELVPRVPELRPNTSQGLGPVPANLREELRWRHRAGMGLSRFALEAGQQAAQAWSYADAVSNFGLQVNRLEALYQVQRRVETPRSRGRPAKVTYEYRPLVHDRTTGEPVLGQGEEVVPIRMRTHEERARERMLETVTGEGELQAREGFLRRVGALSLPGAGQWQQTMDPSDPAERLERRVWSFAMRRAYGARYWEGAGVRANPSTTNRRGAIYERMAGETFADVIRWATVWRQPPPEHYPWNWSAIAQRHGSTGTGYTRCDHALVPRSGRAAMNVDVAVYDPMAPSNRRSMRDASAAAPSAAVVGCGGGGSPGWAAAGVVDEGETGTMTEAGAVSGKGAERAYGPEDRWGIARRQMAAALECETENKDRLYRPLYRFFRAYVVNVFGGQCESARKALLAVGRWAMRAESPYHRAEPWVAAECATTLRKRLSFDAVRAWYDAGGRGEEPTEQGDLPGPVRRRSRYGARETMERRGGNPGRRMREVIRSGRQVQALTREQQRQVERYIEELNQAQGEGGDGSGRSVPLTATVLGELEADPAHVVAAEAVQSFSREQRQRYDVNGVDGDAGVAVRGLWEEQGENTL
jgi:hypothetical protein